ncbi:MAG: matrixin family metalloprotease [Candidatus Riflebacteria bacterium]|nr:matrixin family metalloprotease [Candidatus Riflebacteria bacterium]
MRLIKITSSLKLLVLLAVIVLLPGISYAAWIESPTGWIGNWGGPGTTVTYSFATTNYVIDNYTAPTNAYSTSGVAQVVPEAWKPALATAFDTWSASCGLNFVEVADSGQAWNTDGAAGDIRIALTEVDPSGVLAYGYMPTGPVSAWGDIHFDSTWDWYVGSGAPGASQIDLISVAVHELGHAIGVVHNDDPTSVMSPTYTIGTVERDLGVPETDLVQLQYGESTPEPATMLLLCLSLGAGYFMSSPSDDD